MSWAEDFLYDDILGGCAEVLYRIGRLVFIGGGTQVGRIEDSVWPDEKKKYKVQAGDYRYGCCSDIILRPVEDKIHLMFPEENWFAADLNKTFKWKHGYLMKPVKNWQTIIKKELLKHEAEFVFTEVITALCNEGCLQTEGKS